MPLVDPIYSLAAGTAARALPLVVRGRGKAATAVRGMRGSLRGFERWAEASREAGRPLVWLHAPSVGEGYQARAVMEAIRALRPDVQIAYTFFSPSAQAFARTAPADVAGYLPFDTPSNARRLFDALRPAALAFTKTEAWPGYVREGERRGVPVCLLSATLPPDSSRLGFLAQTVLTPTHRRLAFVAAISADDADRYAAFGIPSERRHVMGDARFDQVARRAARVDRTAPLLRALSHPGLPTIVAGSTWPPDEDRLLPAFESCLHNGGPVRLIVAPHEPRPDHLARLESLLSGLGLSYARLGTIEAAAIAETRPDVVVVDRVGVLGDLYALADVAYVGGGFGMAGLHSVLEPAAFGVPVLFGPNHDNAREARALIQAGAAAAVAHGEDLRLHLDYWLTDPDARTRAGTAAREYVEANLGAAERGAQLVLGAMVGRAPNT